MLGYVASMLWVENELSPPESVVAAHSLMLVRDGTLYYDLQSYPHTVSAYMPIFYLLEAGMIRIGLPAFLGGRLISLAALLGLVWVAGRLVHLYTRDPLVVWCGRLLVGSSPVLLHWGTVGQVDMLTCFFSLLAFYWYSCNHVQGDSTLTAAGVAAGLAFFTKHTGMSVASVYFTRCDCVRFSLTIRVLSNKTRSANLLSETTSVLCEQGSTNRLYKSFFVSMPFW